MTQWRAENLIFGHPDEVWDQIVSSAALNHDPNPTGEDIIDSASTVRSSETDFRGSVARNADPTDKVQRENNKGMPLTPLNSNKENQDDPEDIFFIPSTCPPPRADEIDRWQHHIAFQQFGDDLQSAAAAIFPNTTTSRYKNVYVLMIKWEDEDPKLPVSEEIKNLERVFKDVYLFATEVWSIPDLDCHAEVKQKILDFKRVGGNCKDDLKVVYYAGHGKLTRNRLLSWTSWQHRKHVGSKLPTVKWSGIQNVLEEAESDILLLLDCCHAGTANTNEGHGVTELISAGAYNTKANGVGPYSFTNALVLELEALASKRSFSTAELYNNIFCRIQLRMPEDDLKTERHPAPIHIVLTNDSQYRRSIHLSKSIVSSKDAQEENHLSPAHIFQASAKEDGHSEVETGTLSPSLRTSATANPSTGYPTKYSAIVPRLALAIRFFENFRADECATALLVEWLKAFPLVAEHVKIEAAFDSFSSLWIISIPISIYAYLEHHPAVTCLGPITSSNKVIAVNDSPIQTTKYTTEVKSQHLHSSLHQDEMNMERQEPLMPPLFVLSSRDKPNAPNVMSFPPVPRIPVPSHVAGTGSRRRREESEDEDHLSESSTQLIKRQRVEPSGSSESVGAQLRPCLLRCIHNAIHPHTFSVNPETGDKYRACIGPGWKSIKQVKEHMQRVHSKQPRTLNPLQCNRCQNIFSSQKKLQNHELIVDCPICCPDCPEAFASKTQRQLHQQKNHPEEITHPVFQELDESGWQYLNAHLKVYTDSIKSKNGVPAIDPIPGRRRWVEANTARFEAGRSKARSDARLELGQWYTISTYLGPSVDLIEHPFYDDISPLSDPEEETLLEKLLSIFETSISVRVDSHGPPPFSQVLQREWYREALYDSIKAAARDPKGIAPTKRLDTSDPSPSSSSHS